MLVLGIESSCDESAVALIEFIPETGSVRIIFEQISSQEAPHAAYGGVVPELASREHIKNLPILVNAVREAHPYEFAHLDRIAVTRAPGLKGCLLTGIDFAKGLSVALGVPMVGVNHIEGHLWSAFLSSPFIRSPFEQDSTAHFLALIVSGGHTEIHTVYGVGNYVKVARTTDDAAGEAFDKSAALLGFPYPGGALLSKSALSARSMTNRMKPLTLAMRHDQSAFSFSGLKTAFSLRVKKEKGEISEFARLAEDAIVEQIVVKVRMALDQVSLPLVVSGGVSANTHLRSELQKLGVPVIFPERRHCTDNAAMIALVGAMYPLEKNSLALSPLSRWPVESMKLESTII